MVLKASSKLLDAVAKYQAGEQHTFDTIYHESVKYVTRCVLNVLNRTSPNASADLLQDIIQETYLTISRKLDTLQDPGLFLQWAGQIATRHALRTWKKDTKQHENEVPCDEITEDLQDYDFIPEDILLNKEKQRMIRQILAELPTNQYLCVVEYYYNQLKEKEIAEKLDMPVNTVKTHLFRARKKLKAAVETTQKKTGVRLYSLSGMLLVLLWKDALEIATVPARDAAILGTVHATIAGTVGAQSAGAAAGGVSAKLAAAVLAGAITVGGIAGAVALTSNDRQIPEDAFTFAGHSYYVYDESCETWEDAARFCESLGGHLAVITSEEENAALHAYMVETGRENVYLGLYLDEDNGNWKWINDEPVTYLNWHPGEPNHERELERYGMFYYKFSDGTWNDGDFGQGTLEDSTFFLCEWES